ncbi:unnamed protein product [Calypogeia fissa]
MRMMTLQRATEQSAATYYMFEAASEACRCALFSFWAGKRREGGIFAGLRVAFSTGLLHLGRLCIHNYSLAGSPVPGWSPPSRRRTHYYYLNGLIARTRGIIASTYGPEKVECGEPEVGATG